MRYLAMLAAVTIVVGCASQSESETTTTTPAPNGSESALNDSGEPEAAETTDAEPETTADEDEQVFVIDVRSQEEWDSGHVEQAVHIPHTEIAERIDEVTDDRDAKIVVYCAVGGRAGIAKEKLEELGFTNVENGGGYDDVKERFE